MSTNRRLVAHLTVALTLVFAAAAVPGCDLFGRLAGTGTVNIQITDGPFPFDLIESATVTITEIKVLKATTEQEGQEDSVESEPADDDEQAAEETIEDGDEPVAARYGDTAGVFEGTGNQPKNDAEDAEEEQDEEEDNPLDGEWVTIFEGEQEFNLLDLRNGRTDLLANASLEAGKYVQLRLVVTEGTVTLTDGREFVLKVPSGSSSGIKLHFTFTIEEGQTTPLLLDVDLSRAFKVIPGSAAVKQAKDIKGFKFQPSLAMRLIDVLEAGEIAGSVTDTAPAPLAGVTVTAYRDGEEVAGTSTEEDGTYTLIGLPAGTYKVAFAAEGYTSTEVENIGVTAGATTEGVNAVLVVAEEVQP